MSIHDLQPHSLSRTFAYHLTCRKQNFFLYKVLLFVEKREKEVLILMIHPEAVGREMFETILGLIFNKNL